LAADPSLLSARYADPVKQLEAEVEMAWSYYSELIRCINKQARKREKPGELEKAEKEAHAKMRDDLDKEIAKSGGNPAPELKQMRDVLIYTINETAVQAAERFRLGEPKLVTTESLQAAIEDEKNRAVPICGGTPSFRGSISGDTYTSANRLFSVRIPKPSNWAGVAYAVTNLDTTGSADHDDVMFRAGDFGIYLVAGAGRVPADSAALMDKDDARTVLRNLSQATLMKWRADLSALPPVVQESFIESPQGQAIVRVYRAEKGSFLARAQGRRPTREDAFDTNIASLVTRQESVIVYALAQNDSSPNDAGAVAKMATDLFRDMTIMPLQSAAISPQTSVAHLEDCIEWGYRSNHYGAVNDCKESSSIQFMLINDQRVIKGEVEPGAFFDTGLTGNQVSSSRELFTACPVGYVPSVPFSLKYQDEIQGSRYNCLKK
jgi:hypothetical protein